MGGRARERRNRWTAPIATTKKQVTARREESKSFREKWADLYVDEDDSDVEEWFIHDERKMERNILGGEYVWNNEPERKIAVPRRRRARAPTSSKRESEEQLPFKEPVDEDNIETGGVTTEREQRLREKIQWLEAEIKRARELEENDHAKARRTGIVEDEPLPDSDGEPLHREEDPESEDNDPEQYGMEHQDQREAQNDGEASKSSSENATEDQRAREKHDSDVEADNEGNGIEENHAQSPGPRLENEMDDARVAEADIDPMEESFADSDHGEEQWRRIVRRGTETEDEISQQIRQEILRPSEDKVKCAKVPTIELQIKACREKVILDTESQVTVITRRLCDKLIEAGEPIETVASQARKIKNSRTQNDGELNRPRTMDVETRHVLANKATMIPPGKDTDKRDEGSAGKPDKDSVCEEDEQDANQKDCDVITRNSEGPTTRNDGELTGAAPRCRNDGAPRREDPKELDVRYVLANEVVSTNGGEQPKDNHAELTKDDGEPIDKSTGYQRSSDCAGHQNPVRPVTYGTGRTEGKQPGVSQRRQEVAKPADDGRNRVMRRLGDPRYRKKGQRVRDGERIRCRMKENLTASSKEKLVVKNLWRRICRQRRKDERRRTKSLERGNATRQDKRKGSGRDETSSPKPTGSLKPEAPLSRGNRSRSPRVVLRRLTDAESQPRMPQTERAVPHSVSGQVGVLEEDLRLTPSPAAMDLTFRVPAAEDADGSQAE